LPWTLPTARLLLKLAGGPVNYEQGSDFRLAG
jgi:hypothetical protein